MESLSPCWHLITPEYPPQSGGVSDYTYLLASGLAAAGCEVHVWCPRSSEAPTANGVKVHRNLGTFTPADLREVGRQLDRYAGPRRMLVQWVPHGYGYRSMNLAFCLWLRQRAVRCGDRVDLMVHEPFLPFRVGRWRQNAAAVMHRLMTIVLLRTARQVWVSTPRWGDKLRPYDLGKRRDFICLPIPSTVPTADDSGAVKALRSQYASARTLVGHFGTFGPPIAPMVYAIVPDLLQRASRTEALLIGPGSGHFRERIVREHPELENRIHALGQFEARDPRLSYYLSACDLLLQPYPDGVTSRRTTIMAALAHGRPAVTSSGTFTEPFWESSGAVVLAPANDSDAFVAAALRLIEDPHLRVRVGQAGADLYRRNFDMNHVVRLLRETARTEEPYADSDRN